MSRIKVTLDLEITEPKKEEDLECTRDDVDWLITDFIRNSLEGPFDNVYMRDYEINMP